MKIWEEALPLDLQASHPNHHHQHPTIPVGMWESLKTVLRNPLLKSGQTKASFSPPSTQVIALITGVQQLEDTFRIVIWFWRLAQYFGSGGKRRSAERRNQGHDCVISHSEWYSSLATWVKNDICSQRYRLPNESEFMVLHLVLKLQWRTAHGLSVCWYLLYKT